MTTLHLLSPRGPSRRSVPGGLEAGPCSNAFPELPSSTNGHHQYAQQRIVWLADMLTLHHSTAPCKRWLDVHPLCTEMKSHALGPMSCRSMLSLCPSDGPGLTALVASPGR